MIKGASRQHAHHVIGGKKRHDIDLLKAAVIYGANASGKTNLIKAMHFAQKLITQGTRHEQVIPLQCFRLDELCKTQPSKFEFEFKSNGRFFIYGFTALATKIEEEWLYETKKATEALIFERSTEGEKRKVDFGDLDYEGDEDEQFLQFIARSTRPNQLFLTECMEKNFKLFTDAYMWFADTVQIIFPTSHFSGLEFHISSNGVIKNTLMELLNTLDTGIVDIDIERVDFHKGLLDVPDELKDGIAQNLHPDTKVLLRGLSDKQYLLQRDLEGSLTAYKLVTKHASADPSQKDGNAPSFDLSEESDGTRRLFDLLPALVDLRNTNRVFIIDELDRSLHPALSRKVLELFLENSQRESQLIVTTHEASLLDLELLRRDEIWFVEKDRDGSSSLYSLEEFTPRYDKDIRKGYLLGRFGAIPILQDTHNLRWAGNE